MQNKRMRRATEAVLAALLLVGATRHASAQVKTDAGSVEGITSSDQHVRAFLGLPYAAPPVGGLRWQPPQPVTPWPGVRTATAFGARCMQGPIFTDMIFRDQMSEDCLYLNVWAPSGGQHLPVMVWIYGGGFQGGSASEPRQDGSHLASKGVILVSMNYRLGVFGFLAHPDLTKASASHASGNYGLLDQIAALAWVQKNIAAFGGDPGNVTIFGESAGSFSVSALMVSPLAKGLFHRAIGESGAYMAGPTGLLAPKRLAASEALGIAFSTAAGADSIAALRAKSADEVLEASLARPPADWFSPTIDGYVLPDDPYAIFTAGHQNRVSLLAGWNAGEGRVGVVLGKDKVTAQSFAMQTRERYKEGADAILRVYPATSDAEALESAAALAGDLFIGYGTWKWLEAQLQSGPAPVYRYSFDRNRPVPSDLKLNGVAATAKDVGARHAGEIEYVFGALASDTKAPWEPADTALADLMMSYWTNFARSGNPNGPGLPDWPAYQMADGYQVMHLSEQSHAAPDAMRPRYLALDDLTARLRAAAAH
jgi:para-nitrobenzyl esterase